MERYMMILKSINRMNPELEQALRENVYPITVKKDEIFQNPNARLEHLYFIEKGLFQYYIADGGKNRIVEFKREDQFIIGLKNHERAYQREGLGIEAVEDSLLWCIPGELAKELLDKYPRFIMHYHVIKVRDFTEWARSTIPCDGEGSASNVKYLREIYPDFVTRIPIHLLANFTRVSEDTFRHLLTKPIKLLGAGSWYSWHGHKVR